MLTPVSPGRPSPLAWVQARCRAYARLVRWGRERTQELPPPFIAPALSEGKWRELYASVCCQCFDERRHCMHFPERRLRLLFIGEDRPPQLIFNDASAGLLDRGTGRGSCQCRWPILACMGPKSPNFLRLVQPERPPVPVETGSTTASHQPWSACDGKRVGERCARRRWWAQTRRCSSQSRGVDAMTEGARGDDARQGTTRRSTRGHRATTTPTPPTACGSCSGWAASSRRSTPRRTTTGWRRSWA
jgi:hypothetical protein